MYNSDTTMPPTQRRGKGRTLKTLQYAEFPRYMRCSDYKADGQNSSKFHGNAVCNIEEQHIPVQVAAPMTGQTLPSNKSTVTLSVILNCLNLNPKPKPLKQTRLHH